MALWRSGVRAPSAPSSEPRLTHRRRSRRDLDKSPPLGPLRERSFRLLFLGRTTSFVGNAFANVALAFAVLDLTGSKAGPRLRPGGAIGAAGDLPPGRRHLGRPAAAAPRDGLLERRERPQPGRDRGPLADRPGRGLAADGARRRQRAELGVLLPGGDGIVPQTVPQRMLQPRTLSSASANASWIGGAASAASSWRPRARASGSRSTPRRSRSPLSSR